MAVTLWALRSFVCLLLLFSRLSCYFIASAITTWKKHLKQGYIERHHSAGMLVYQLTSLKIQTTKLSILSRFYFYDVLEQLKTNFHANFRFKRVLDFVMEYAWISKLYRDAPFTWRPRELSCRLKKMAYCYSICIRISITLYCILYLFLLHPIGNTLVVQYQLVQGWLNYVYIIKKRKLES